MGEWKCEVIRDLMPLVADDVASGESKRLVQEHTESCEQCRAYFAGMTVQIERTAEPAGDTAFIKFCRRMQKGFRMQKLLLWLLIIAVTGAAFGGFVWRAYHNIYTDSKMMPLDWVDAQICQAEDGEIVARFTMAERKKWYGRAFSYYEGDGIYYIEPLMPVWPILPVEDCDEHGLILPMGDSGKSGSILYCELTLLEDGRLVYVENEYDVVYDPELANYVDEWIPTYYEIKTIRLGDNREFKTIYNAGDPIPKAGF